MAVEMGETFMRGEIREGRLRAHRLGKRVLKVKGSDLQAWFDAQQIPSANTASLPSS